MDFSFGILQGTLEAREKGDSKQMVAPLCAAREQRGKWRGAEDGIGAYKYWTIEQGLEWNGGEVFDDYC